ncbi:MAG: hypothetical protein HZB16_19845 [Armatimonadetes bacterium]|nr:hypothetical protein [Armatimonadota bacterium]
MTEATAKLLEDAQAAARAARHEQVLACCDALAAEEADADTLSESHFLRGDAMRHLGRWAESEAAFRQAAAIAEPPSAARRAVRAWRLLSELARRGRRWDQALDAAAHAERGALAHDDAVGAALASVCSARVLSDMGRGAEADALYEKELAAAERHLADGSDEWALVMVITRTAASLAQFRGDDARGALAALEGIDALLCRVPHAITCAAYYRQVAILLELGRRYSSAVRTLNRALDLYDRVGYEPGRYDVYWSLSRSYIELGDLRTARLCLRECVAVAERLQLRVELGKSKSSFADLAVREGRYAEALALYAEDLALSRDQGDQQALGHCTRKLASCHHLMHNLTEARELAEASVHHFEATGRGGESNASRVLLVRILVEQEQLDEASAVLARVTTGSASRPLDRADWLCASGLVRRARGDLEGAAALFAESLALHDPTAPSRALAAVQLDLGVTCRLQGRGDEARAQLVAATDTAGFLGSRDLWVRAVDELRGLDLMDGMRQMLKPYLPNRAVMELSGGDEPGGLGTATMMFVDMRSSTQISGTLAPDAMAEVVDAFLGPVVRIILNWGGTVDKFIGDCVVAVFGLANDESGEGDGDDGATAAVWAGLEIIDYMEATKEVRRRTGASVLEAAIGINTGCVASGCFGPLLRRDYTVLGYHVNLAQRMQVLAGLVEADTGTRMIISGFTRAALAYPVPADRIDLSHVLLKGVDGDVEAWLVRATEALNLGGWGA